MKKELGWFTAIALCAFSIASQAGVITITQDRVDLTASIS
jgi:hypothetical protein